MSRAARIAYASACLLLVVLLAAQITSNADLCDEFYATQLRARLLAFKLKRAEKERGEWRDDAFKLRETYLPLERLRVMVEYDGKHKTMSGREFSDAHLFACACDSVSLAHLESWLCKGRKPLPTTLSMDRQPGGSLGDWRLADSSGRKLTLAIDGQGCRAGAIAYVRQHPVGAVQQKHEDMGRASSGGAKGASMSSATNAARAGQYLSTIAAMSALQRRYAYAVAMECGVENVKASVDGGHGIDDTAVGVISALTRDFEGKTFIE